MSETRTRGPVEILCKEIGIPFQSRLEKPALFIAFVRVLADEIETMLKIDDATAPMTGKPASLNAWLAMQQLERLVDPENTAHMAALCVDIHGFIDTVAPEEVTPYDHRIGMMSACVSALRFGLEIPCHSRHAAEAANYIWQEKYGVRLFDGFTAEWQKEWARAKFRDALVLLWLGKHAQ